MYLQVLDFFQEINNIPRKSSHEEKITQYIRDFAIKNKFTYKEDHYHNIVIKVPASKGYENSESVAIQAHTDMVCEKIPTSKHDFNKDPIINIIDGDWIRARETSLGADNGIGVALALTMAQNDEVVHPPLELVITREEEIGLVGAMQLPENFIQSKTFINLDAALEDGILICCAGASRFTLSFPFLREDTANTDKLATIEIFGLQGGHSGEEIHLNRSNANLLLGRALKLISESIKVNIVEISSDTMLNAIPREVNAIVSTDDIDKLKSITKNFLLELQQELGKHEPDVNIKIYDIKDKKYKKIIEQDTRKIINALILYPNGVESYSPYIDNLVSASNNLARVNTEEDCIKFSGVSRAASDTQLDAILGNLSSLSSLVYGKLETFSRYPAWQANLESPLLKKVKYRYKNLFGIEPKIEGTHGGLECGVIAAKYSGIDMISIGPLIEKMHSPQERLSVSSTRKITSFLAELLKDLC